MGTGWVQLTGLKGYLLLRRSPLFRLLGSVLALVVAANAALAGRPHGCDASRAASLAEPGSSAGHGGHGGHGGHNGHGAGQQADRTVPEECSCIDHACGSSAVLVLVAGRHSIPVAFLGVATFRLPAAVPHTPSAPPHLHPYQLGPPAHLS